MNIYPSVNKLTFNIIYIMSYPLPGKGYREGKDNLWIIIQDILESFEVGILGVCSVLNGHTQNYQYTTIIISNDI